MNPLATFDKVNSPTDYSAALAAELAADLHPANEVFLRNGIDTEEAKKLLLDDTFRSMIKQAKRDWASADNSEERIRLKAKIALEEMLPLHFNMAIDPDIPPSGRNKAVEIIKSLAGMDIKEAAGATGLTEGERFVVNINLGNGEKTVVDIGNTIENEAADVT